MRQTTHEVLSSMPNLVICATLEFKNISLTCTSGVIYTIYQKIKQRMSYCEKLNLNESWYLRLRQSLGCMQVPLLISVCRWVYVKSNSVILYTSCACHACTVLFNKYTVIPGCHVIYVWILLLSNTLILATFTPWYIHVKGATNFKMFSKIYSLYFVDNINFFCIIFPSVTSVLISSSPFPCCRFQIKKESNYKYYQITTFVNSFINIK